MTTGSGDSIRWLRALRKLVLQQREWEVKKSAADRALTEADAMLTAMAGDMGRLLKSTKKGGGEVKWFASIFGVLLVCGGIVIREHDKDVLLSSELWRIKLYLDDGNLVYTHATNCHVFEGGRLVFWEDGRKHDTNCRYHAERY